MAGLRRRVPLRRSDKPMKQTPLKRGTSVLRRSRIKQRASTALADYNREFEARRPLVEARAGGRCEALARALRVTKKMRGDNWHAGTPLGGAFHELVLAQSACTGYATHIHHRKYRSRGGTNKIDNLLHCCSSCHSWIHAHGGFGQRANLLGLALSADESEELE